VFQCVRAFYILDMKNLYILEETGKNTTTNFECKNFEMILEF
jgi:hypothetical protein